MQFDSLFYPDVYINLSDVVTTYGTLNQKLFMRKLGE